MLKKLFITLLLMVLLTPCATIAQDKGTTDMWDLVNSFTCSTGRQHGVVYDGEYIYTSAWGKSSNVLSMFYKYDLNGNLIEEFDVPGVTNSDNYLRDMTYDGQYVYGCDAHSSKIWCYDLRNKTLVSFITTSYEELGHCTYDPVYDAFWVGERAGGSSPNLTLNLKLINRNGEVIKTASPYDLGTHSIHGTGYFTDENGVAHLYLFAVQGFTAHVFDYEIEADHLSSTYIFDFGTTPGFSVAGSAGGLYIGQCEGSVYFFGDADQSPNLIGIYALGEYTPVDPTPPDGDLYYDFNDGIMRWTTIDADGDGYNWTMRQNWNDNDNRFSVTSASFDALTETILTPENYLVSPYKLDCEQIVFKACAQDVTAPAEHVGVAVSTTGNTNSADFTIIWETDLTAKTAGNWYEYNIDLRAYQGQNIYVAIVHFNCSNQFMLNVDDVILFREYDETYGLADNANATLTVYPNPTSGYIKVKSAETVDYYEIYSITGALISRHTANAKSFDIDLASLPEGTYLLQLRQGGKVTTQKIVVN